MKLRILVADDEEIARSRICRLIKKYYDKKLESHDFEIFEAVNGLEAVQKCMENPPDILFLDVKMPGLNGFEVLQQLKNLPPGIIFQTAFSEFAIKAFETSACDYLLKPFSEERFFRSFDKAQNNMESIQRLRDHLVEKQNFLQRISIKSGNKVTVLAAKDICFFMSRNNYTFAVSKNQSSNVDQIVDLSLSALSRRLDPEKFLQIHRNCIVNLDFVEQIKSESNQSVCLIAGMELPVSRANRKQLLAKFKTS